MIFQDLTSEEETELLSFLDKNSDVFAWKTFDLTGVRKNIIEHKLHINPSAKPRTKSFVRCQMKKSYERWKSKGCWTQVSYERSNTQH
jgi:hypothetical protein